jgi:glycosyltransferase involved in cell wall biosynthesis
MSKGYRIGLVSAFPPGTQSLNEYGFHLVRHFALHPDVAEVIVFGDELPAPQAELDMGPKVKVLRCWEFNAPRSFAGLMNRIRREAPDVTIFNIQMATFGDKEVPAALGLMVPARLTSQGLNIGVLAHNIIAGVDLEQTILKGQPLRQWMVRKAGDVVTGSLMKASYVTVTLPSYYDILHEAYPEADVTMVPHGVFDTEDRTWVPLAERPKKIATMGKFGTYKKLETLLAAFDLLRKDPAHQDVKLVIGGTGHPNTPGYMKALEQSRAGDSGVIFHGYVAEDDVAGFFEGARVSVFDYESTTGSSGVLHQTASYGAVPVFPHIGDFVDVTEEEGLKGIHYAPGSAQEMADAIAQVIDAPAQAEDMARTNRDAAVGMPMSDIVEFHLNKIAL